MKMISCIVVIALSINPFLIIAQDNVQDNSVATASFLQRMKASMASLFSGIPTITFDQAKNTFIQKAKCLINYKKCTHRDRLIINGAWGFALGYGIGGISIGDKILKFISSKIQALPEATIKQKGTKEHMEAAFYLTVLVSTLLLPYAPLWGPSATNFGTMDYQLRDILTQDPVEISPYNLTERQYAAADLIGLITDSNRLLGLIIINQLIQRMKICFYFLREVLSAAFFDPNKSFFVNIFTYLKLHYKCLWDLKYCKDLYSNVEDEGFIAYWIGDNPEQRRETLYYWAGFLSGVATRKIANATWNKKLYQEKLQANELEDLKRMVWDLDKEMVEIIQDAIIEKKSDFQIKTQSEVAKIFNKILTEKAYRDEFLKRYPIKITVSKEIADLLNRQRVMGEGEMIYEMVFEGGNSWNQILNIKGDANKKDINTAYKKLSLLFHPDKMRSLQSKLAKTNITVDRRLLNKAQGILNEAKKIALVLQE